MKQYKELFKNVGFLTISNFSSKLLVFVMLPFYTRILTTQEYGTIDLFNTTIQLVLPILTINIAEAVLRFCLSSEKPKTILKIGIKVSVIGFLLFAAFIALNRSIVILDSFATYWCEILLLFATTVFSQLFSAYSRGIDHVLDVSVAGIIGTIVTVLLNVLFLAKFNMGIQGYLAALNISGVAVCIYYIIRLRVFSRKSEPSSHAIVEEKNVYREMRNYSLPLIFNSIGWWINNALDRYFVIALCGISANGIYSVAYKIPSILTVLQTIFSQAWTLSAVKFLNDDNKSDYYSQVYRYYNFMNVTACSIIIILSKIIAHFLYAKDFYYACEYVPFLLISVVFGSLSGFVGAIFAAYKDTKVTASSTMIGAAINCILNALLIYNFGVIGAAIATMVSYCAIWLVRMIKIKRYIKLRINYMKDISCYLILLIQSYAMLYISGWKLAVVEIGLFVIISVVNFAETKTIIEKTIGFIKDKMKIAK